MSYYLATFKIKSGHQYSHEEQQAISENPSQTVLRSLTYGNTVMLLCFIMIDYNTYEALKVFNISEGYTRLNSQDCIKDEEED